MMTVPPRPAPRAAPRPTPLARLVSLRRFTVLAQGGTLLAAVAWLRIPLEVAPMLAASGLLALANLLTQWRLTWARPVSDREFFGQLLLDTGVLAVLLYYAGGSANPFVSLFLLPPTLAAVALPARHAWAMAGISAACYTFLMFWNLPLPPPQGELAALDAMLARASGIAGEHAGHVSGFALHVIGMWFNFGLSAAVVVFFLTRATSALRERERELAAAREAALRHEQILALGTLAAGAAHKLGTPLSTMAVVLRELELTRHGDRELQEDLALLRTQVDACKDILSGTLASAGQARDAASRAMPLAHYLERLLEDWQLIRPRVQLSARLDGERPGPAIAADRTLEQALLNLLDNAADASPVGLEFTARWDRQQCCIEILDRGPGLDPHTAGRLGQPLSSAKRNTEGGAGGLGIGFFLSNATLERFGGRVEIVNRPDGGAATRVCLPLDRLADATGDLAP